MEVETLASQTTSIHHDTREWSPQLVNASHHGF